MSLQMTITSINSSEPDHIRVLQAQARLYFDNRQYNKSAQVPVFEVTRSAQGSAVVVDFVTSRVKRHCPLRIFFPASMAESKRS
jgi:hypothetical protein